MLSLPSTQAKVVCIRNRNNKKRTLKYYVVHIICSFQNVIQYLVPPENELIILKIQSSKLIPLNWKTHHDFRCVSYWNSVGFSRLLFVPFTPQKKNRRRYQYTPLKLTYPWKVMVGRWYFCQNGLFSPKLHFRTLRQRWHLTSLASRRSCLGEEGFMSISWITSIHSGTMFFYRKTSSYLGMRNISYNNH